jgi:hypothetical protein
LPDGEFTAALSVGELADDKSWVGTTADSAVDAVFPGALAAAVDGATELPQAAAKTTILKSMIVIEKRPGLLKEYFTLFNMGTPSFVLVIPDLISAQ